MAHLASALLGTFEAALDSIPVQGLNSARLRALLAFLAVESRRELPRDQVASLLWPERPDAEVLSALRNALSKVRGALDDRRSPTPFLLVTRTSVRFNQVSDHWLDVAELKSLSGSEGVQELERAAALYRGPFLHGLSLADSPAFGEWVLFRGEEYQRRVLSVLGRLTYLHLASGETASAARWARRQLELDPYREQAHRQLMAALALGGERTAALAHYETCRRLLVVELGCAPEDRTQALYAQIREGTLPRPEPPRPAAPPHAISASAQPLSRFVAREAELARLGTWLDAALAGQGGMVVMTGEPGSGKTALLEEWARRVGDMRGDLIVLRGSCNAHAGAGDPYLPFREILQTLAGDVEGKRAGGTLSPEMARRVRAALSMVGAALTEHGPDLIDTFVPGDALLRRAGRTGGPAVAGLWQARLQELVLRAGEGRPATPQPDLFAQVTQVLAAVSVRRPLLLVVDDFQWADGGTAALVFHLGRRLAGSRILLVCACRPEALVAQPATATGEAAATEAAAGICAVLRELIREWGDICVDLDEANGRAFVEAYLDSEPNRLGTGFRQALYEYTGGNPLFTVELLRSFERQGNLVRDEAGLWVEATAPDWERWPPQVEAVIAAHLAGLPEDDRALLEAASVQGEQFVAELAARALGRDEQPTIRRLSGPLRTRHRLVRLVSLERLSTGQRLSRYRFRHWLVQRSACGSLDEAYRSRLHEATARAMEALYGGEEERPAALAPALARHLEAAGLPLASARYRLEAGRWAAKLAAYEEAIAHLERGLALLERVPASGERLRLELGLCMAMGTPVMIQRGWQAPAHRQALERLSYLTQHPALQDDPQRISALGVLALSASWSADPETSRRVGEQLLSLASSARSRQDQGGDRQTLMLAHWALGHSHWVRGQPIPAREHLGRAVALYNPETRRLQGGLVAADPGVMARAMLGAVLWQLGYPDQARACFRQGVAQAREQPSSLAFVHFVAAMTTSILGRDMDAALGHSEALRRQGPPSMVYGVWAEVLAALAQTSPGQAPPAPLPSLRSPRLRSGQPGQAGEAPPAGSGQGFAGSPDPDRAQAVARAVEALTAWQAAGSGAGYAGLLMLQAELCARAGMAEIGLEALDRAQAWIDRTGMRALAAEVRRMRGELLLALIPGPSPQGRGEEAEACFQRALDIAREQGSRWWELRAALSLAQLWGTQGRREEARELLDGVYGWFTEGFDTPGLVEAGALLE